MLDIGKFSYQEILQPENWKTLFSELENIIGWNDTKTAYQRSRLMEEKIKGQNTVPEEYLRYIAALKWVALPLLREADVLNLTEKYFNVCLEKEISPLEKLKHYLIFLPLDEEEDVKDKIAKILERSSMRISEKNITLEGEAGREPSIQNWLIDYRNDVMDKAQEELTLARSEYFSLNKNFLALDEKSRQRMKILFDFYEFLKTPGIFGGALTHDVIFQWPDGSLSILDDTGMYKVYEPPEQPILKQTQASNVAPKDEILKAYHGDAELQKKISQEESRLRKEVQRGTLALEKEFFSAVQKKNIERSIAVLRLFSESRGLIHLLEKDEKLKNFLSSVLEKSFGKDAAQEFLAHPSSPKFVRYFLKYVLHERLGLPEGESARIGAQLGNILKKSAGKEYSQMAYFDMQRQGFRWME